MAERRYEGPKSKSFDTFRDEASKKSKSRKKHHSKYESKTRVHRLEARTPPLPTGGSTIEELIKQRETLQEELNKIADNCDSECRNYNESRNSTMKLTEYDNHSNPSKRRKSVSLDETNFFSARNKQQTIQEDSPPHYDDNSEDEENIIEIRRKRRKQLLEKLNVSHEDNHTDVVRNIITNHKNTNIVEHGAKTHETELERDVKDSTDMFAEIDNFAPQNVPDGVTKDNNNEDPQLTDNWDDPEGYYNIRIGDVLNSNRYTIKDILGQGVFANVVRAEDNSKPNTEVAIKITRNNDLMHKIAVKEVMFLKQVNDSDPEDKFHCVKFFGNFIHKGHLCLILEPLHMDMRCVIKKYGRHGLNLKALVSYSRQLLLALKHLKKIGIIHADVKPDNILVNEKKNILKLCDFGSAGKVVDNDPTPYLVSRFYRAPEIILGITYSHGVDLWSAACTIYEMAVGKIMFTGSSNNKMLKCFMDVKGRMPNRLIKKGKFKDQHFNYNNNFLLHKKDEITGRDKVIELVNIKVTRDLVRELKKSISDEKKLTQLKELLDKMLILDPAQRISVTDALRHIFIREELKK